MEPSFFPENFQNFYPYPSSTKRFIDIGKSLEGEFPGSLLPGFAFVWMGFGYARIHIQCVRNYILQVTTLQN